MKKIISILAILLAIVLILGYTGILKLTLTGSSIIVSEKPTSIINYPKNGQVVHTTSPVVEWIYQSVGNEEQTGYEIKVDTDVYFRDNPIIKTGTGNVNRGVIKIAAKEQRYYVKVLVENKNGLGEWSNTEQFYLDLDPRTCDDGTPFFNCAEEKPKYCYQGDRYQGELIDRCFECGCPAGYRCTGEGKTNTFIEEHCEEIEAEECADGTAFNECSSSKPYYCAGGALVEDCSKCNCPNGYTCIENGQCEAEIIVEMPKEQPKSFFQKLIEKLKLFL